MRGDTELLQIGYTLRLIPLVSVMTLFPALVTAVLWARPPLVAINSDGPLDRAGDASCLLAQDKTVSAHMLVGVSCVGAGLLWGVVVASATVDLLQKVSSR